MKIQNPILSGFNADPSIIFVEPYYYIANSTFEYYPGVQIHRSLDLVNWETVARPIDDSKIAMRGITASCGVWAPCLSYCNGIFYLVYSNVTLWTNSPFKDVCNYIISTTDVTGEWSNPVYINSSGFDASLFHDFDGKSYFVNMEWDFRNPEADAFTGIILQEIDRKTFKLKGEPKTIFCGTDRKLVEGPHIYKKGEYYYLLTAEGGTVLEHAATIARSKNIWGDYEIHPNKHVVSSWGHDCYLKKAGHASLCVDSHGEWYMAHLSGRHLIYDRCPLGRETSIQNIEWINDWPYITSENKDLSSTNRQAPRDFFEIKNEVAFKPKSAKILFDVNSLRLRWQSLRNSIEHKYTILDNGKRLELRGGASYMNTQEQSMLAYRQQDFVFEASVKLTYKPECFQHLAGMTYRYNEHNQYLILLTQNNNKRYLTMHSVINNNHSIVNLDEINTNDIYIKLKVDNTIGQYYYSVDNISFKKIGNQIDVSTLSDEIATPQYKDNAAGLGFTGAFVGIYCGDFKFNNHFAVFSDFEYRSESHK
ncbi:MAG: glycoside hydrolase family 43 protein [Firmicutes bacterium]|nr:glycoside hydrolase family 43 protein [Bacillota bacterium]MCL1953437.1 glycoside hydrolase family 43 protein [Bacillota bacterium]